MLQLTAELSSSHHAKLETLELRPVDAAPSPEAARLRAWQRASRILLELLAIVTAAALCWRFWHPALYALTLTFIGARQYSIAVLMEDPADPGRRKLSDELLALAFGAVRLVPRSERDTLGLELCRVGFMLALVSATWIYGAWLELGMYWLAPLLTWAALSAWIRPKLGLAKKLEPRL